MTDVTVDRRKLLVGMGAAGGVIAALGFPTAAHADDGPKGPTGSWLVNVKGVTAQDTPPYRAVWSFVPGGVMISSDQRQAGQGGEEGRQSSGQGVWVSEEERGFHAKYVKWGGTPDGRFFAMLVHEFRATLDAAMSAFDATGTLTNIGAVTGRVLFTQGFTAHGERMLIG